MAFPPSREALKVSSLAGARPAVLTDELRFQNNPLKIFADDAPELAGAVVQRDE